MKKIIIWVILLIRVSLAHSQVGGSVIPVEDVVKEFYKKYNVSFYDGYITFEKRKNDWYVVYNSFQNKLIPQEKYLFYDGKAKKFRKLELDENTDNREVNVTDYVQEYDIRNFNLQPYFGYSGWYKDVIKEQEAKQKLSDDELYGLARAYSAYAGSLISDAAGNAVKEEIWKLPFSINSLTPAQINSFTKTDNKAIENFRKLADRNPGYETVVGKIGIKYANEYMFQYQLLLTYADKYASGYSFPANLYSDQQLEAAKIILEACPQNAIFLSYGDNDYYPVHYLQKAKGLRKDVYVINYSLIALDRHIYRITFPQYDAVPVKLSIDTSSYSGNKHELIYIKDSAYSFDFSEISKFLRSCTKDDMSRCTINANTILIYGKKEPEEKRALSLGGIHYLTKDALILLDIINNLNGRKICFPNEFYDQLKGLNQYLIQKDGLWIYDN
jgi:hypothetical protein